MARTLADIHNIRLSIERIGHLSDDVIQLGPVRFGLDGFLEMIPFAGELYSLSAGVLLLVEGARARVPLTTQIGVVFLIGLRTLIGSVDVLSIPIAGPLAVLLGAPTNLLAAGFRAHRSSANLLIRAIDETYYVEMSHAEARKNPDYDQLVARIRSGEEKRRIVFLG
jgi:hypothetical protein